MIKKLKNELTIIAEDITLAQWNTFVIETNLMIENWRRGGPKFKIQTPGFDRIIKRGKAQPGDKILLEND